MNGENYEPTITNPLSSFVQPAGLIAVAGGFFQFFLCAPGRDASDPPLP
jgi:hypothetical protein